jgi:hypothetical protein
MKVAIYSRWPLAAAPLELMKALKKYTDVEAAIVQQSDRYPDGRIFPHQFLLGAFYGTPAQRVIERSDVWHVNNYFDPRMLPMQNGHAVLAQFHSIPRQGGWQVLWQSTPHRYTIRQPLHEREYKLPGLPNIIDPDEYRPQQKIGKIKIAFAPSSKAPIGFLCSKGRDEVKAVLHELATKRDVEIVIIQGVPYEMNLELKSKCHILIDDVVTGNWHRTSLEGAVFGCAVVNKNSSVPWVQAGLENLKERLFWLIDHPNDLRAIQEETRLWALEKWHAMDLVKEYVTAYEGAVQ